MKKRYIAIAIAVVVVAVLPWYRLLLYGKETPTERIERICGIELPEEMDIEYDYYTLGGLGEVTAYSVFHLKKEPTEFLNEYSFGDADNYDFENEFTTALDRIRRIKGKTTVKVIPSEYYPDWESGYSCKGSSYYGHCALYFPNTLRLVVLLRTY
ncbi:MAG: hypothetical protein LBL66_03635 [Clostridiales bacterium]|jgi:hypothetical protein|nr:hypothetical protein [Clostridiales bacterium]